jgi:hypothetical protein
LKSNETVTEIRTDAFDIWAAGSIGDDIDSGRLLKLWLLSSACDKDWYDEERTAHWGNCAKAPAAFAKACAIESSMAHDLNNGMKFDI